MNEGSINVDCWVGAAMATATTTVMVIVDYDFIYDLLMEWWTETWEVEGRRHVQYQASELQVQQVKFLLTIPSLHDFHPFRLLPRVQFLLQ